MNAEDILPVSKCPDISIPLTCIDKLFFLNLPHQINLITVFSSLLEFELFRRTDHSLLQFT